LGAGSGGGGGVATATITPASHNSSPKGALFAPFVSQTNGNKNGISNAAPSNFS
jgi:hypothetical protein